MGNAVADFEREFASFVGAKHCIALTNGTVTLEVALRALGVKPGDRVATTCLTMAATSIAILNVGAVPVYCDVDPETWLLAEGEPRERADYLMPVSLYGLHSDPTFASVDDAAQTLRPHCKGAWFTSYSFQTSKILSLGEGGMLATNDDELARVARSISSLGYDLPVDSSRIDKRSIKSPSAIRHVRWPCQNSRMNELTAREGHSMLVAHGMMTRPTPEILADDEARTPLEWKIIQRHDAAICYRDAVDGCSWIRPQHVPEGWGMDYWSYAVALDTAERWEPFAQAIERNGGTRPWAAWALTYREPAFRHLNPFRFHDPVSLDGHHPRVYECPVAESLQPRIMAFTTNNLADAERNAEAVRKAIKEIGGVA